jgi:hypothetical protein
VVVIFVATERHNHHLITRTLTKSATDHQDKATIAYRRPLETIHCLPEQRGMLAQLVLTERLRLPSSSSYPPL